MSGEKNVTKIKPYLSILSINKLVKSTPGHLNRNIPKISLQYIFSF